MTGDPARKVIQVLISWQPDPGLWRAKTRTCHSQDPGPNNRVTRTVPSRNPVSEAWCMHQERNGLSGRLNDTSQEKGQSCLFSPEWSCERSIPETCLMFERYVWYLRDISGVEETWLLLKRHVWSFRYTYDIHNTCPMFKRHVDIQKAYLVFKRHIWCSRDIYEVQ